MNSLSRHIATKLIRYCAALLPPERAAWAIAMKAEVDALEENDAVVFAAGCVWASLKERVFSMNFATQSVRVGGITAMLVLALVSALSAERVTAIDASIALVDLLSSAIFAAAVIWSFFRGSLALIQAASTMAAIYGVAFIFLRSPAVSATEWTNVALYRALALEGLIIWAALLAGGIFVLRTERRAAFERV
jgi:hypothetical protein